MEAKKGDLRVWYIGVDTEKDREVKVESIEEAIELIKKREEGYKDDGFLVYNTGLEVFASNSIGQLEWQEYYDEEGYDILDIIERKGE